MKSRLEIANDINYRGMAGRTIAVDKKLNLREGQEYKFYKEVESWAGQYADMSFQIENDNLIQYYFRCENIEGHEVDYENEEECEVLDCEGCESEGEVLVKNTCRMIIKSVSTDEDFKEMGYYEIQLERI